ncbi:MAG: triose-phosphate isomerase [Methylobacteriaceae bacterium]|jgi:triosephosphate isomerase|nr:triose-phosphate isomerase [Methylobacteriaceae bacterium]
MSTEKPRPLIAGNWKMNGLRASQSVLDGIREGYTAAVAKKVDVLVCPPTTLLHAFAVQAAGSGLYIGAQDCHTKASGAYTGDISAEMIQDSGGQYVILGHSERRQYHGETDALVNEKTVAAHRAGLTAVVCIGETREERESGKAIAVVKSQLKGSVPAGSTAQNLVIAYEPVWAIGTGLTPTVADVAEVHAAIREDLIALVGKDDQYLVRILYGGSVKPSNAAELLGTANVDGALVGGASLVAKDFLAIVAAVA